MKKKTVHYFVISAFTLLYVITSLISTVHVVDFFALTNPMWLAIGLAVAYEVGAAASLASIVALRKMNKTIVWALFIVLTAMQAMGNTYFAYSHAKDYQQWIELFGLVDEDIIYQKRILGLISGAILPMVALGFIKALVDYIKPDETKNEPAEITEEKPVSLPPSEPEELPQLETATTTIAEKIPEPSQPIEESVTTTTEPEVIPATTEQLAVTPQLNNIDETTRHTKTVDEIVARGEHFPVLKRPHDP
jgi:hypothetical protein